MSRILFVALANDVGIDRLPAAMAALGAACAVLCPPGFYCTLPRGVRHCFALPRHRGLWLGIPFVRSRLEAASRVWDADLVVPLDNVAAQVLRVIARSPRATPALRHRLETSLGAPAGYADACSRSGLLRIAARHGIGVPRFCVSRDPAMLLQQAGAWGYPVVLKSENTCGGHGVTIAPDPCALRAALAALRGEDAWQRVRGALRRRAWTLAGLRETTGAPPVLQAFVQGVPAMRTVSAWQGRVLDGVSFAAEQTNPAPTGPSTLVRHIENPAMAEAVSVLVAALGCSGFISVDFMLDEATGEAALIEMNPRPIGTTHLGRRFGHDLCAPLLACVHAGPALPAQAPAPAPALPAASRVALFPKEIEREPANLSRLDDPGIRHDVPHDEPAVIAAYLRRLTRLYPGRSAAIIDAVARAGHGLAQPLGFAQPWRANCRQDQASAAEPARQEIGG